MGLVYWPRTGLISKRNEEFSVFDHDWIPQPIIKIRHKDLSFEEADELAEHYFNKASETETEDSECDKPIVARTERLKKRLAPQVTSLPRQKQYALTNTIAETSFESPPMFGDENLEKFTVPIMVTTEDYTSSSVEPIYIAEENYESTEFNNHQQCQALDNLEAISTSINKIQRDVDELKLVVSGFGEILAKILSNTSSVDKCITEYLTKKCDPNENEVLPVDEEDFTDLESLKIKTYDELVNFEQLLADKSYQLRIIRFLKTKFRMNGYGNGQTIFTMVIRLFTETSLFLPYSWKGINRKESKNISFEANHKMFTAFMCKIVRTADNTKVEYDVSKMFENLLRFKKINNERPQSIKMPSSRSRPKGMKHKPEIDEVEQTKNNQI